MNRDFAKGLITGLILTFLCTTFMVWLMLNDKKLNASGGESEIDAKLKQLQFYIDTYYIGEVNKDDLKNGAYTGYVSALGDEYSAYYTVPQNNNVQDHINGTFEGIGVAVTIDPELSFPRIKRVYENSPAEEAGLKDEDLIVEVEGQSTKDISLDDVVSLIKGEVGTEVRLLIRREGEETDLAITAKRGVVDNITVASSMLDNNIGYIYISSFETTTIKQFDRAVDELQEQNAKAIIIDLRNNGGGIYYGAIKMIDRLLPKDQLVVYTLDKNGKREDEVTVDDDEVTVPMAILVNSRSASASEVFAGCLKDYEKAVIVGEKSFGKGIMQTLFTLQAGDSIKLTTAYYYSPKGINIHGTGIEPNIQATDDPETENDEVIEAAVEYLLNEV